MQKCLKPKLKVEIVYDMCCRVVKSAAGPGVP